MAEILEVKDGVVIVLNDNRCVMCGEIIPEGRQVCWICERKSDQNKEVPSEIPRHGMEGTDRVECDTGVQRSDDFHTGV